MRRGIGYPRTGVRSIAMRSMRRAAWLAGLMAAALGAYVVTPLAQAAGSPAVRIKLGVPVVFNGTAAVGALFTESDGKLVRHFCTASVVDSPGENLLITAAHCIQGKSLTPLGHIVFAPGYHNGKFPHGIWIVRSVYVNSAWAQHRNQNDDVAFLVAGRPGTRIQRHTGAQTLAFDRPPQVVDVIGYPNATNRPITCTARARNFDHGHQMVFDCDDYTNGTSGGPFLAHVNARTGDGQVIGVIGGYQEGGDTPDISYSPRFFANIRSLYETAIQASTASGATLTAPSPGS
jgi:V8-like Glu-specific endopeptidase